MKTLRILVLALLLSTMTCTYAQFSDSYRRMEVSFASINLKEETDDFGDPLNGVSIGVAWGMRIAQTHPLYVEYGANVAWASRKIDLSYDDVDDTYDFDVVNIAVPLNLVYNYNVPNKPDLTVAPLVGLNFKFNVLGKCKEYYNDDYYHVDQTSDLFKEEDEWGGKRFQIGMNVGLGLYYKKLYLGYRYQPDFIKFLADEDIKTSTNFVTLGISF